MRKLFEKIVLNVIAFEAQDVLMAGSAEADAGGSNEGGNNNGNTGGGFWSGCW